MQSMKRTVQVVTVGLLMPVKAVAPEEAEKEWLHKMHAFHCHETLH